MCWARFLKTNKAEKIAFSVLRRVKNNNIKRIKSETLAGSVTISRAFARKGRLKIFVRAQKKQFRAMRKLRFFSRFLKLFFAIKISK